MKSKKKIVLLSIGLLNILLSLIFTIFSTSSTFNERSISFQSTYKENNVTLKGSYFEKQDAKYACLICP